MNEWNDIITFGSIKDWMMLHKKWNSQARKHVRLNAVYTVAKSVGSATFYLENHVLQ